MGPTAHRARAAEPPPALRVTTRRIDDDRPLLRLLPSGAGAMFVHGDGADERGVVGWGEALRLTPGPGRERVARMAERLDGIAAGATVEDPVGRPGSGLVAFVSASFAASSSSSVAVIPRRVVGRRDGVTWLTTIEPDPSPSGPEPPRRGTQPPPEPIPERVRYAGSSMPDLHWLEAVATAVKRIEADEVGKVVLARDHAVWARHPFDARVLARRLRRRFPSCFTFLVDGLLGASPELLVRRAGVDVASVTLAGTAPRGDTAADDDRLGAGLLASDKDRREHAFAAADVRTRLESLCSTVDGDEEPVLLRLDNLQHLASRFSGRLAVDRSALGLAAALHPTPAVGGTPTGRALALIDELEGMDRGRYAGPVGWVDGRGDGELAIALRCAELAGARARLFAGAGIVAGSLPEDELEETRVKLRAMQSAFSPEG